LDGAADLPSVCVWLKQDWEDAGIHFQRSRNVGATVAVGIESRDCNASLSVGLVALNGEPTPSLLRSRASALKFGVCEWECSPGGSREPV
jgi:hypothetical protein